MRNALHLRQLRRGEGAGTESTDSTLGAARAAVDAVTRITLLHPTGLTTLLLPPGEGNF